MGSYCALHLLSFVLFFCRLRHEYSFLLKEILMSEGILKLVLHFLTTLTENKKDAEVGENNSL